MTIDDLPTPCLVLDRSILRANLDAMAVAVGRLGVALRPHMKTAKSIDVARLAMSRPQVRTEGITVSTVAEAEYFVGHGINDILYAVGITPQKLERIAALNMSGASVMVVTDDIDMAERIGQHAQGARTLIEIDCGENRGGVGVDSEALLDIATALRGRLAGVVTHAGHSYAGRSIEAMAEIAETERRTAVRSATRLRAAGFACPIVSVGSSPTALHARALDGVTETRPGVYMFGDLFQAQIRTTLPNQLAVTVLASIIGRRPAEHRIVVDAGGIALSKDRSTQATEEDCGFGRVLNIDGVPAFGRAFVQRANQEHGVIDLDPTQPFPNLQIGDRLRIQPNHVCMTAAAHDRYFVVDGTRDIVEMWPRINGW
jgi:D-serine deaminase-like pyridoxal phosphate-dependent protein